MEAKAAATSPLNRNLTMSRADDDAVMRLRPASASAIAHPLHGRGIDRAAWIVIGGALALFLARSFAVSSTSAASMFSSSRCRFVVLGIDTIHGSERGTMAVHVVRDSSKRRVPIPFDCSSLTPRNIPTVWEIPRDTVVGRPNSGRGASVVDRAHTRGRHVPRAEARPLRSAGLRHRRPGGTVVATELHRVEGQVRRGFDGVRKVKEAHSFCDSTRRRAHQGTSSPGRP